MVSVNAWHFDTGLIDASVPGEFRGFRDYKNFEPMQFTGLKDKNGKEIYEGDIFREIYDDDQRDAKIVFYTVVRWDEKNACFFTGEVEQENAELFDLDEVAAQFEVIGNIYENPELLRA